MSMPPSRSTPLSVRELMTPSSVSVGPATRVRDALLLLERYAIRHLPVVEEERVVGVLSKNDLRETLGAPDPDYGIRDHLDWPVSRVMTDEVVTVRRETSVTDAIDLLISKQIGAVPVVDDQQQLVGVLSVVDVLRAARRYFA